MGGFGDGAHTRKSELQKVVLDNVVTPLIEFLEYGIDVKSTGDTAAEGADLKVAEEAKSKESPESELPGPQKTLSEIVKSKVRPFTHPAMKSRMEKTLEQSRCLVL